MKGVRKEHLPSKVCPGCGKAFSWRKKWQRCWGEVVWCSKRCRASRERTAKDSRVGQGEP